MYNITDRKEAFIMTAINKFIAKVIANVANAMAVKACGAASAWGTYQPKEPKKK